MNVTSDLDLYLSSNQVKLLAEIADQFGRAASTAHSRTSRSIPKPQQADKAGPQIVIHKDGEGLETLSMQRYGEPHAGGSNSKAGAGVDSGFESDLSALTSDQRKVTNTKSTHRRGSCPVPGTAEQNVQEQEFTGYKRRSSFAAAASIADDDAVIGSGSAGLFSSLPPLDILLTAGRISCTVYTHKVCDAKHT